MSQPLVFISYSHKDEEEKERLLSHLGVLGKADLIDVWSDDRTGAGADWESEIREAMAQAKVAILLVSANFLTSDFILAQEVPTLLRRRQAEGLTVFPVITKACAWKTVDWLARMNVKPKNGRPVWSDAGAHADEDLATIAEEVAAIVKGVPYTSPEAETRPSVPLQRPPRAAHFTGRADELAQLLAQLQPGQVVTLCGPGGVGKTALAAEAIWTLAPGDDPPERFPDGIIFHTFYIQPQAALALEAIARAYGEEPKPSPRDAVSRGLSGRVALLVLDGAENADDLQLVLSVAGRCGVLVTTRRHTDAPADWEDIKPLPNPQAVELLQAWGGDRAADEVIASRICTLVGALPLAVRLAGRYMAQRGEEAADYLTWLEETPLAALHFGDRQRESAQVLMERSAAQLSQAARAALGVVGILALASFDRAMVAVALEVSVPAAGRALGELVDYGLLLRDEQGRYQTSHALVHTYARERLGPAIEVIERLAGHYTALTEEESKLGLEGYARLDAERPHLMAVLARCVQGEAWQESLSLAWAISGHKGYLDIQGHWTERVTALQAGLAAARVLKRRYDEGAYLGHLGNVYGDLGQVTRAIEHHGQALVITREIGDRRNEGIHLGNLGLAYADLGEPRRAIEYHQQALVIAREICAASTERSAEWADARRNEGIHLGNLGLAYADLGEPRRAIEFYDQALAISREIGDRGDEGADLGALGLAYADLGEPRRAIEYLEQALVIAREIGDRRNEGNWLGNLGLAYVALGEPRRVIEYHEQALAIAREIGDRRNEGAWLGNLGLAYADLEEPRRATEFYNQALVISREVNDRRGEGIALGNLGEPRRAMEYLEQALAIFEEIESPYAEQARRRLAELRNSQSNPRS
jgi:tetratricopeptide (TPR) repeat protein